MNISFFKKHLCLRAWCLITLVMCVTGNAYSALNNANSTFPMTLESAIKRTLANNPQLHEFDFKHKIMIGEAKTAALKPSLVVGVEAENFLGSGQVSGIKDLEVTLTLSSVIEMGDKIHARTNVSNVKRQMLVVEKQVRTLDILTEVMRRYIDVLAEQETVNAFNDAEQLARYTYQAVTRRVEAGASPLLEQKRAEAALASARLNIETAKLQLQTSIKSLSIMWGEQQPAFSLVQGNLFSLTKSPSFQALISTLSASPHIQLFAKQSHLQAAHLRLANAANRPDVNWTAGVRRINGIDETAFVAGASVPLFTKSRNLGDYEAQKARLDQIEQQKQASLRNLYHQVNQALDARNRALLKVSTFQQNIIPPLKESLELVEKAYSDGRFSYLEWVSTRQELLNAQHALIQSAKQAHKRGADIEALTGISIVLPSIKTTSAPIFKEY
ncbi:MAG: cobalt-zinc-cadmium efflux system outer membrane protein [Arenicella sp.]|jgi:cobalt-zinc-cadmium efflux system outer membrane protein